MIFSWEGRSYDTSTMDSFETGVAGVPQLFLCRETRSVFVVKMDHWTGISVYRASADEVRALAQRHGLPQLLSVLDNQARIAPPAAASNDHPQDGGPPHKFC